MMIILVLIAAYLLGSIPCGILLSRAMGEGDLRNIGSGNIGATNALRTGNKKLAVLTLLGDMLKGTLAVALAVFLLPDETLPLTITPPATIPSIWIPVAMLVVVLGHVFPVWLKFKGGKGVATALGATLPLSPFLFLLLIATWGIAFKATRISALGALSAFALAPMYGFILALPNAVIGCLAVLTALIFWTHRENIRRILSGDELAFKKKKNPEQAQSDDE